MKYLYPSFLLAYLFISLSASASVSNDTPCTPDFMGTLDTATDCPFSSAINALTRVNQSNAGASAEVIQPSLMNCGGLGDMPVQTKDMWYSFIVKEHTVNVILTSTMNTPFIALYQYTGNCMAPIPVECAKGSSGYINVNFQ